MTVKGPPIREETRNRCLVVPLTNALRNRLCPVSLEHFHFLYEASKLDFSVFVIIDDWLIEFMKPKEFSRELLDEIWTACLKPKGFFRICVWKQERARFETLINTIRSKKLARLMAKVPHLDKKTLDVYNNLSSSSQLVVNGGIDEQVVERVRASASYVVSSVIDSQAAIYTLTKMITCDPTLYDHSASVAMLCSIISQQMLERPLSSQESVLIAECGLFHDAGKTCVQSEILNKPGRVTAEEFAEIKKHTIYGREELSQLKSAGGEIDDLVIRVAYEHHEKFNGKGYPEGRAGQLEVDPHNGIHLYSRICMIADVYSALLMKRVYKEAYEPGQALKIMIDSNDDYDPLLFKPFVGMVVSSLKKYQNLPPEETTIRYVRPVNGRFAPASSVRSFPEIIRRTPKPEEEVTVEDTASRKGA